MDTTGLDRSEARSLLAKFGLGAEHIDRAGAHLSPGERTRALLAELMAQGVNCLVLDEPTNHLDLEAIEQLESALEGFDGTMLDRKSTRLTSSHYCAYRMPTSARKKKIT